MDILDWGNKSREIIHTSASAMSAGVLIHWTVYPSFSIALTKERMLPAT